MAEVPEREPTLEREPTPGAWTGLAAVDALLAALLAGLRAALGEARLVGVSLYGSLALGDFDPASSDVDFVAVTEGALDARELERLRALHAAITASGLPFARRLEGSYIPRAAWRRYDPGDSLHPTLGVDWPFQIGQHDANWVIERHIVREHGIALAGPAPATLLDPVAPGALRAAVCQQLDGVWAARVDDAVFLRQRAYQGFAILTLCRALYVLRRGDVASKPRAAAWAEATYPAWQPVIVRALAWRADYHDGDAAEVAATMVWLRAALAEARRACATRAPTG